MVKLFGIPIGTVDAAPAPAAVAVDTLPAYIDRDWGGEKFYSGFGPISIFNLDYWSLRAASAQLFRENLYARGLVRRLITNVISTGLTPEASPDESIIGVAEDSLNDWTETVENRFGVWARSPALCDWERRRTYGQLQAIAKLEAFLEGDVLKITRVDPATGLPQVQLISGSLVQTPFSGDYRGQLKAGHEVRHGVELDPDGRHVAFWVRQKDGSFQRLPAFGPKSGRRIAKLVYACDKRMGDVRGEPLLAIVLQSLKEIDRYRDAAQRKAVVNSILAMFIKKGEDKLGTLPIAGGAVRRDKTTATDSGASTRSFNISKHIPGVVIEELQHGEEPTGFQSAIDIDFGAFEEAIIQAVAWANEVPPEILRLAFSNNYSASQAAINEFKIYLHKEWGAWGDDFCADDYRELLLTEVLSGRVSAPGFLDAWRDPKKYDVFNAWLLCDWYGQIKPSTDQLKQAKGSQLLVTEGWSTNAREARITTGTKYSKNIKRLKRENELKAAAARPLLELKKEFGEKPAADALATLDDRIASAVSEAFEDYAPAAKG